MTPTRIKDSQLFAQKKIETIEHLKKMFKDNKAGMKNHFHPYMEKLIKDFHGEEKVKERIVRKDGKELTNVRVVMFPDKSYARYPREIEMEFDRLPTLGEHQNETL